MRYMKNFIHSEKVYLRNAWSYCDEKTVTCNTLSEKQDRIQNVPDRRADPRYKGIIDRKGAVRASGRLPIAVTLFHSTSVGSGLLHLNVSDRRVDPRYKGIIDR
ncbi:hypothetical protein J6590_091237 [Homalodisca vitripennis]|nr:hypothetical protein J6590_091237 [Homalodisca vitripennis]